MILEVFHTKNNVGLVAGFERDSWADTKTF